MSRKRVSDKPLKIDLPYEDAVKAFMRTPPPKCASCDHAKSFHGKNGCEDTPERPLNAKAVKFCGCPKFLETPPERPKRLTSAELQAATESKRVSNRKKKSVKK